MAESPTRPRRQKSASVLASRHLTSLLSMQALRSVLLFAIMIVMVAATRPPYCGLDLDNPPLNPSFSSAPPGYYLRQVNLLFRHGDRLPIDHCWANDAVWDCNLNIEERSTSTHPSWTNVSRLHRKRYIDGANVFPGKCMAGQLTKYGYDQHLVNGANLRAQYIDSGFMPSTLEPKLFYLRSTDVPRTLQSAQAVLRGMYGWGSGANQTEILDVFTVDEGREYLYPNPWNCPMLNEYETDAKESPAYRDFIQNVVAPLMTEASVYYGMPVSRLPTPIAMFDCLAAHKCHKMLLPGMFPDDLYNRLVQAMEFEYKYIYNYPSREAYGALAMGQLYTEIYNNMRAVIRANQHQPFSFYSAHDTSVMPFLNAIGAWDGIWAPYASLLQMELWVSPQNDEPLVRWIYNRQEIVLPGCDGYFCTFSQFSSLVQPLLLKDPVTACKIPVGRPHASQQRLGVYTHSGW